MKSFAEDINRLSLWLLAIAWVFISFIAKEGNTAPLQAVSQDADKCPQVSLLQSSFQKEHPATFSSFDSPQVYIQSRKAEDKGKNISKFCRTGIFIHLYPATDIIANSFQFIYTHFSKYLFILYCVLLI